MAVMKALSTARNQIVKSINQIPIKWGRYIGTDMQEQKVIFFGHEKAIYGTDGDRLDEKLIKIEDGISDAFSETKDYAIGDYCIYLNSLYKFTTAKPAGAWDGTAVVPVSISQEISSIKAEVEGINSNLRAKSDMYFTFFDGSSYGDLDLAVQACVDSLPENDMHTVYFRTVYRDSAFMAIIQKYRDHNWASAIVFSYAMDAPAFYCKKSGSWRTVKYL